MRYVGTNLLFGATLVCKKMQCITTKTSIFHVAISEIKKYERKK